LRSLRHISSTIHANEGKRDTALVRASDTKPWLRGYQPCNALTSAVSRLPSFAWIVLEICRSVSPQPEYIFLIQAVPAHCGMCMKLLRSPVLSRVSLRKCPMVAITCGLREQSDIRRGNSKTQAKCSLWV